MTLCWNKSAVVDVDDDDDDDDDYALNKRTSEKNILIIFPANDTSL